jgi:hypothetical protein
VYYSTDEADYKKALWLLFVSSQFVFLMLTLYAFLLNASLCLDLYFTVRNPFVVGAGRTKHYMTVSFLLAGVMASIETVKTAKNENEFVAEQWNILICYGLFFLVAVYTTFIAARRILKVGVSLDVRKQVLSRHIKYIFTVTLTFSLYVVKIILRDIIGTEVNPYFSLTANMLLAS